MIVKNRSPFADINGVPVLNAVTTYGPAGTKLEVNGSAVSTGFTVSAWTATAGEGPSLALQRSKSATIGTQTILALNDMIGQLAFRASTGAAFVTTASIRAEVDAAVGGATDVASRLAFYTTPDGSVTQAEKMRLDNGGRLLINGTAAYGRYVQALEVNGSGNMGGAALNTWSTSSVEASMLDLNRSKSATKGDYTIVASGDLLGYIQFRGADGAAFVSGAGISAAVDGTPGSNDMPSRLMFGTTADAGSAPTERLRIDSSGRVLIGQTTTYSVFATPKLELAQAAGYSALGVHTFSATAAECSIIELYRSKSATLGTRTVVADGDALGMLQFRGEDGAASRQAAYIAALVDGTPGSSDMPARLTFGTTVDGASSSTERLRITSSGQVIIGWPFSNTFGGSGQLIELHKVSANGGIEMMTWSATAANAPLIEMTRSRSTTPGQHTIVQDGDIVGQWYARASDGADWRTVGAIRFEVDGTPGTGDMPGRIVFRTSADGGADHFERLRIDNRGYFGFGTAAAPDGMVEFAEVQTITGGVTDGYSASLRLDPGYTAATAQTVTRHNYIEFQNVSVAGVGPAAVTDACLFSLDAALGTHLATTNTDVTGTAKSGTLKVNANGTIVYLQCYAGA